MTRGGRRDGDDDDARAFEDAMRGARPLDERARRKQVAAGPAPARGPAPRSAGGGRARAASDAPLEDSAAFRVEASGATISGRANGVDARVVRALAAGDPPVDARLDLHGLPAEKARAALERFVAGARGAGRRAILVIHGRGAHSEDERAVLKPLAWRWLATSPAAAAHVLAFVSARPAQGGDGATLILLRRPPRP